MTIKMLSIPCSIIKDRIRIISDVAEDKVLLLKEQLKRCRIDIANLKRTSIENIEIADNPIEFELENIKDYQLELKTIITANDHFPYRELFLLYIKYLMGLYRLKMSTMIP